jgi:hypothetical protein
VPDGGDEVNDIIQLRNGERVHPEEYPPDLMPTLNRNLDKIRDERFTVSDWIERVLSIRAVSVTLTVIGAALIGWASFHTAVTP